MIAKKYVKMSELSNRIYQFIERYADIRPDWDKEYDDEDEKFTSPDASQMKYCADMINNGLKPKQCWSEWGSGGSQLLIKNLRRIK